MTPSSCGYLYGESVSCGLRDTSDLGKACIQKIEQTTDAGSDARTTALLDHHRAAELAEKSVHTKRPCAEVADSVRHVIGYTTEPSTKSADQGNQIISGLFTLCALIAIYFTPGIIAHRRVCKHENGIVILNTALGWTIIGWIAALIWAVSDAQET